MGAKIGIDKKLCKAMCEKYGNSVFINDKLLKYRRHNNNQSKMNHYSLPKMIKNRITFIKRCFYV